MLKTMFEEVVEQKKEGKRVAIIPCAGKGLRMKALTRFMSKELLPVQGKACVDWAIEEAMVNNLHPIIVSNAEKKDLNEYLETKEDIYFVEKANGMAEDINECREFYSITETYVVILPDIVDTQKRVLNTLLDYPIIGDTIIISVESCPYGVFINSNTIIEKPNQLTGRYITKGIFDLHKKGKVGIYFDGHMKRLEEYYEGVL